MAGLPKAIGAHRAAAVGRQVVRAALWPLRRVWLQGGQGQKKKEEKGKRARSKGFVSNDQFTCSADIAGAGWRLLRGQAESPLLPASHPTWENKVAFTQGEVKPAFLNTRVGAGTVSTEPAASSL